MLQLFVDILETDVTLSTNETNDKLICQFLWGSEKMGELNSSVRMIFQSYIDAAQQGNARVTMQLSRLITLIVNTTFGATTRSSEKCHLFALEFSQHLKSLEDVSAFEFAIQHLDPIWWKQIVCQKILDSYDNSLVCHLDQKDGITLGKIISSYCYLVPPFKFFNHTPHKKNSSITQSSIRCRNKSLTRRNAHGETKLHLACIKNQIPLVRELLANPGIDVNASDHYGWTPLHESCNHGHVECVKLLLEYQPTLCVENYMNQATKPCDTEARNVDGITALHDAVDNNQVREL